MIRNLLFLSISFALSISLHAQSKRYIFMEHFTNTRCGICAATNPGYYQLLSNYKGHYHHLSIHPAIPYSSCLLYQANKDDQDLRTSYYSIIGTPTIVFNGTTKKSASSVNAAFLDAELKRESPIQLKVTENGGSPRSATIVISTYGAKPSGKHRLYVALAERVLDYASPNGEKTHHDVFRDFMSAPTGDPIVLADQGGDVMQAYSMDLQPSWNPDQIYVLAWVQDEVTREVLNSGTKLDLASSLESVPSLTFAINPNPVGDKLMIQFPSRLPEKARLVVTNLLGRVLHTSSLKNNPAGILELDVQRFDRGIYFARIESGNNRITKKWVKQ
ncbi:MAG: Omp28-related outer membrane protein [Saprospiraceae bacterium]|nr:Omp28-related outer membrane protein [Saprospiraceae bacterium]